ncbi:hypothetical protein FA11_0942 [Pelosinus fermentans A11]|uniref:Uncharacterized protein n=1 Tax=Pelosinus fermentans B4 TaxID=1149862 RepID=I8RJ13_9FIRM|nr:hypothetical protein FB4_0179 [Pelosinus fermentans B4]EIW21215.1 hypothetical protein FA11_0942 [Pelosinus fermentans A11]
MAIRPKVGARVVLRWWEIRDGVKPPAVAWTGTVVKIRGDSRRKYYDVQRDADGYIVTAWAGGMDYEKSKT